MSEQNTKSDNWLRRLRHRVLGAPSLLSIPLGGVPAQRDAGIDQADLYADKQPEFQLHFRVDKIEETDESGEYERITQRKRKKRTAAYAMIAYVGGFISGLVCNYIASWIYENCPPSKVQITLAPPALVCKSSQR